MASKRTILALDVGEKRIGVAIADTSVMIAIAYETLLVDGSERDELSKLIQSEAVDQLVIGYPRNQSGEPTAQTQYVEEFAETLSFLDVPIDFQDESLTSVKAEELLKAQKRPYEKAEVDSLAASLILQDYLEAKHGRI